MERGVYVGSVGSVAPLTKPEVENSKKMHKLIFLGIVISFPIIRLRLCITGIANSS